MAIPDYQAIMLPLLKYLSDKNEHSTRECINALAVKFNLTDEEKKELLPSGRQCIFDNRVGWARTYLKKAGLVLSPKRGTLCISSEEIDLLKENPTEVNNGLLARYEKFNEFISSTRIENGTQNEKSVDNLSKTPEEILDNAYWKMREDLAQSILQKVKECSPEFFENVVIDLLLKMGYGGSRKDAGKAIGRSGDEGIDGIINEDRLGLDNIYVQAKRWDNTTVGRPEIQKFVGALVGQRAKKGIFITTSTFSNEARNYITNIENKIRLIDGKELAQYMIDFDVGTSKVTAYEIKRIDSDYFIED